MFINEFGEKIFQTLPGQGWQVLVDWKPHTTESRDGHPRYTLEPVIAWVTAKVEHKNGTHAWEDVIIAPLVRSVYGDDLELLDTHDSLSRSVRYLAPGEELQDEHFALLRGESTYRKGVEPRG